MAMHSGKGAHAGGVSKTFVVVVALSAVLLLFGAILASPFSPVSALSRTTLTQPAPTNKRCPIIVYNKQIKTGSTVIANVLYRTTEAYGCRNAGCKLHQMLMTGNATHVGAINGLTLTCHAKELNPHIITSLRQTHGNDFIYVASVREPISWFKSAACFFYRQRVRELNTYTEEGYKAAVDWMLDPVNYHDLEDYLFASLGLLSNSTKREVQDKLLMYDVIIDNADLNEGLKELGELTGWDMLPPSQAKKETYRGPLYNVYRAKEIGQVTFRLAQLYRLATNIREAKHERPAFAKEDDAPKINAE